MKTKKCSFCAEEISIDAKKCKHCGEFLENVEIPKTNNEYLHFNYSFILKAGRENFINDLEKK